MKREGVDEFAQSSKVVVEGVETVSNLTWSLFSLFLFVNNKVIFRLALMLSS